MNGRRPSQSISRTRPGTFLPIVLLAAIVFLAGCASEPQMLTVTVRDRHTQQPVPDAWVQLRPLHLFSSSPPYAIIDPSPAAGGSAATGPDGTAQIQGVVDHPMDVRILAPGYVPLYFTIAISSDSADCPWHSSMPAEDEQDLLKRLEVQLRP